VETDDTVITYAADKTHATIGFAVKHLVISKVRGHFGEFDASLELDPENNLVSAKAVIEVDSIDTANEKRDEHLRAADFFNAEEYPEITFVSKGVEVREGENVIIADFTIRDVTKEIALPYVITGPIQDPWGNTKIGFQASATINRTDYGLTWNKALETGGVVVGEDVELSIEMEFARK
jgi:polyisoprenoid-binding protein YceI